MQKMVNLPTKTSALVASAFWLLVLLMGAVGTVEASSYSPWSATALTISDMQCSHNTLELEYASCGYGNVPCYVGTTLSLAGSYTVRYATPTQVTVCVEMNVRTQTKSYGCQSVDLCNVIDW